MSECHAAANGRDRTLFGVLSWEEQTAEEMWPIKPATKLALTERLCEIVVDPSSTKREVIGAGRLLHAVSKLNLEILRLLKRPDAADGKLTDLVPQAAMAGSESSAVPGASVAKPKEGPPPAASGVGVPAAAEKRDAAPRKRNEAAVEEVPFTELVGVSAARGVGEGTSRTGVDFAHFLNPAHGRRPGDWGSDLLDLPRAPLARRRRRRS